MAEKKYGRIKCRLMNYDKILGILRQIELALNNYYTTNTSDNRKFLISLSPISHF